MKLVKHQACVLTSAPSCTIVSHRDDYNSVPALDPEKLKIFNTVREITGVCVRAWVLACVSV